MGLDMYLTGEKFFHNRKERRTGEPPQKKGESYDLGQWRNENKLHDFIVENYAREGIDDCREIELDSSNMEEIILAIRRERLIKGINAKREAVVIFKHAIEWVEKKEKDVWRFINYRGSW